MNAVNNQNHRALNILSQTEKDNVEFGLYHHPGRAKKQKKKASSADNDDGEWLKERVNALMVVATLIAGIAIQAAINPPGGVWQEDTKVDSGTDPITFTYYLYHMFGQSTTGYWDSNVQIHQQPSALIKNNSIGGGTPNETQIIDFINSLMATTANYSKNVLGGFIIQDEDYKNIVSNYNNSGGSSIFPYLMRYAGYPILGYTYPTHYTIYMVTNTVAFLLSVTIILLAICGFMNDSTPPQVRLLVVLMCISIGCITFGYLTIFLAMTPDYFIRDPILYSLAVYIGLWCICGIGILIWKLISNIVQVKRRHLVGVRQYLKMHFLADIKDASKLIVFICCICAFFIVFGFTIYPSFYAPLIY